MEYATAINLLRVKAKYQQTDAERLAAKAAELATEAEDARQLSNECRRRAVAYEAAAVALEAIVKRPIVIREFSDNAAGS